GETRGWGDGGTGREEAGLPVIVLKGAALAATIYPSIALRPMGDVDLLVPKDRLDQAVAAVRALGYVPQRPETRPGLAHRLSYELEFDGGESMHLPLGLHWSLIGGGASSYRPRIDWFWEQAEMADLPRMQTLILKPTAHLLYLAAHLMLQHGGAQARLLWFYDLDLLIHRQADRLDWDELLRRAREFRWATALRAALQGVQERLGTPLPQGFLDALAETDDHQAAHLVERRADPLQNSVINDWNFLLSLDWPARLRLALATAFPSPAYVRWRYQPRPGWLWPLCYPYRWLDMLRKGLSTLAKLARRRITRSV
ncbi:MAG: nucleotidyltransferase family protein, partial [Acidobacteria bacterium]|nr:nucleotidyltransferase family protein [Acidobacteriota bacterium]